MRKDLCGAENRMRCVNWSVNWRVGRRGQKAHWENPGCVYRTFTMCELNHSYDSPDEYHMYINCTSRYKKGLLDVLLAGVITRIPPPLQEKEESHG